MSRLLIYCSPHLPRGLVKLPITTLHSSIWHCHFLCFHLCCFGGSRVLSCFDLICTFPMTTIFFSFQPFDDFFFFFEKSLFKYFVHFFFGSLQLFLFTLQNSCFVEFLDTCIKISSLIIWHRFLFAILLKYTCHTVQCTDIEYTVAQLL